MNITRILKKNALTFSVMVVLILIILNTAIVYYNNYVLKVTTKTKHETERAILLVDQIWNAVVKNSDVGMRGYALTKSESLLDPLALANNGKVKLLKELKDITRKQEYPHLASIDSMEVAVGDFLKSCNYMVELVRMDSMALFHQELAADPGKATWLTYSKIAARINEFENALNEKSVMEYKQANNRTLVGQTILLIIALPTLLFISYKIGSDAKARKNLITKLEKNNRECLFDSGAKIEEMDEHQVIDNSITNFKTATNFISHVSNGNFTVEWPGITEGNVELNKSNLAGELIQMRDKMKLIKKQDDVRDWVSQGLANFSDVIRKNQDNVESLSFDMIVYLVKYLKAQQGCIFVLKEDVEENQYLEMTACYAFDRKKYVEKIIEIGQGLVGQVFLEQQTVLLTDVPNGYTSITSGLGNATPSCVLVVPLKYNSRVEGVIEIAGFAKFEKYEIEFMEKICEITASTVASAKNAEKMKRLVDQFKLQAEQLRIKEEEMRQNMEEMQATQEAISRSMV